MAVTPLSNEAFLREVDDELRRDELVGFWRRWGRWIAAALVAGLLLFAGVLFWQHRAREAAGREGEQLQAAFDSLAAGRTDAARPALATLATSDRDGYRALAIFAQADLLLQKNDMKGAAARFAAIANDASQPDAFRNLALVRQTAAEFDTLAPQVVIERLRPLAAPGNPWFGSAGEMSAAAHLRAGRRDLAAALFRQIGGDAGVPDTLRQRAVQMAGALASGTGRGTGAASSDRTPR